MLTPSNYSPWRKTRLSTAIVYHMCQQSAGQPNQVLCSSPLSDSWWECLGKQGGLPGLTWERKTVLTMLLTEEFVSVHPVERIPLSHRSLQICRTHILPQDMKWDLDLFTQGRSNQKTVTESPAQKHMSNTTTIIIVHLCKRNSNSSDFTYEKLWKAHWMRCQRMLEELCLLHCFVDRRWHSQLSLSTEAVY